MKLIYSQKFLILALTLVIGIGAFILASNNAQADEPVTGVNCLIAVNQSRPECQVTHLEPLQGTVVRIIYYLWVLGIPVFAVLGVLIGYQYMTSGENEDTKIAARQRAVYWVFGMILFFASQPLAALFMNFFISNKGNTCYDFADTPAFQFFFYTVCNKTAPIADCKADPKYEATCTTECSKPDAPSLLVEYDSPGDPNNKKYYICKCYDDKGQKKAADFCSVP